MRHTFRLLTIAVLVLSGVALLARGGWISADEPKTPVLRATQHAMTHKQAVHCVAFSPDGATLASGSNDNTIKLWDVVTGKQKAIFEAGNCGQSVAFSPDGNVVAAGTAVFADNIKLWDVGTGKELATLRGQEDWICTVAFSPDGKTLATGSLNGTIKLWDVATHKEKTSLERHTKSVYSVAFSQDGKKLASGSEDNTIKLWDVAAARNAATLEGHTDWVHFRGVQPRRQDASLRELR